VIGQPFVVVPDVGMPLVFGVSVAVGEGATVGVALGAGVCVGAAVAVLLAVAVGVAVFGTCGVGVRAITTRLTRVPTQVKVPTAAGLANASDVRIASPAFAVCCPARLAGLLTESITR
jgi:hypothetical protein